MLLGDVIRELREAKQWTQKILSQEARCSQQTIAKIESNRVRDPQKLPYIARALGTTVEAVHAKLNERNKRSRPARAPGPDSTASYHGWPFNFPYSLWEKLKESDRRRVDAMLYEAIIARLPKGRP